MKTISLITVGRDDNFAEDFIFRLHKSISSNIKFLEKNNISFEYIVVDWFPINDQYLHQNSTLKTLLADSRIKNIVVKNTTAEQEDLNALVFYEYFAKNVGIRAAQNDYIFIVNSDIIVPQKMWDEVLKVLNLDTLEQKHFFRPLERVNVEFINDNEVRICDSLVLKEPGNPDSVICGGYSGDFLFTARNVLVEKGKGYNEEDYDHRQKEKWQTGMDGEILWNLHNNGITLEFFNTSYYHIKHGNSAPQVQSGKKQVDGFYKLNAHYPNKPNWGFVDYPRIIENNITTIG
jgi:hypothetical protein